MGPGKPGPNVGERERGSGRRRKQLGHSGMGAGSGRVAVEGPRGMTEWKGAHRGGLRVTVNMGQL